MIALAFVAVLAAPPTITVIANAEDARTSAASEQLALWAQTMGAPAHATTWQLVWRHADDANAADLKQAIKAARAAALAAPSPMERRLRLESAWALARELPPGIEQFRTQSLLAIARDYASVLIELDADAAILDEAFRTLAFREEFQAPSHTVERRFLARYRAMIDALGKNKKLDITLQLADDAELTWDGIDLGRMRHLSTVAGTHELGVRCHARTFTFAVQVRDDEPSRTFTWPHEACEHLKVSAHGLALDATPALTPEIIRHLLALAAHATGASEVWWTRAVRDEDAIAVEVYDASLRSTRRVVFKTLDDLRPALDSARSATPNPPPRYELTARDSGTFDLHASSQPTASAKPLHQKWWFWVSLTAAALTVGAVTATAVVLSNQSPNVRIGLTLPQE